MKIIMPIGFCCLLSLLACTKMDKDTEVVGSFANALCGYEGTITYADGRPAKNYPLQLFVGHSDATIDSATGTIKGSSWLNNFVVNGKTDENGQYKILTANKNINTTQQSGLAFLGRLKFSNYEYFQPEFSINNIPQEYFYSSTSSYGQIQKINAKLYELNMLHINSKNIKLDYDDIQITGKSFSPITGKEAPITVHAGARVWYSIHHSKPNIPIDLTISFYKNAQFIATRTVRMAMDKKDNYLEIN